MVPVTLLAELLDLNMDTGALRWRLRPNLVGKAATWNYRYAGTVAGARDAYGYLQISLLKKRLKAHRIVWALHHGEWPPDRLDIDHIDGDRTNNRPSNLRLAERAQNLHNSRAHRDNQSGYKGVCRASKKSGGTGWIAQIMVRGMYQYLGRFDTAQEAAVAYRSAAVRLQGCFAPAAVG